MRRHFHLVLAGIMMYTLGVLIQALRLIGAIIGGMSGSSAGYALIVGGGLVVAGATIYGTACSRWRETQIGMHDLHQLNGSVGKGAGLPLMTAGLTLIGMLMSDISDVYVLMFAVTLAISSAIMLMISDYVQQETHKILYP